MSLEISANPKAQRGRPRVLDNQRKTERIEMRATLDQKSKLKVLGGAPWLLAQIDKAKEPKS